MRTPLLVLLFPVAVALAAPPDLSERLHASEPQVRSDAFFELFGPTGEISTPAGRSLLYGRSVQEIFRLLGRPSEIAALKVTGASWLRNTYDLQVLPTPLQGSGSPPPLPSTYRPILLFKNGRSVPTSTFTDEYHLTDIRNSPPELTFTVILHPLSPGSR